MVNFNFIILVLLQDDIQANGSVSVNMDHLEQHRIQEQVLFIVPKHLMITVYTVSGLMLPALL